MAIGQTLSGETRPSSQELPALSPSKNTGTAQSKSPVLAAANEKDQVDSVHIGVVHFTTPCCNGRLLCSHASEGKLFFCAPPRLHSCWAQSDFQGIEESNQSGTDWSGWKVHVTAAGSEFSAFDNSLLRKMFLL